MPKKQYNIRWRDSDLAELQRAINNFNAKIYRIRKKHPDMAEFLPKTVKKKEIVESIGTRADYVHRIKSLKRFSERGAEKPVKTKRGAKMTKWELNEFKKNERRVNREKQKQLDKILDKEVTVAGKGTGSKRREMGRIKEVSLKPRVRNIDNMSQKEWDIAKRAIDAELGSKNKLLKMQRYKNNYIGAMYHAGYSQELIDLVKSIPLEKFNEVSLTDEIGHIEFHYDPIEQKLKENLLFDLWESVKYDSFSYERIMSKE